MSEDTVVVLGSDATAFALAADLAIAGREVVLCETSPRQALLAPVRESRQIRVLRDAHEAVATLAMVTEDPFAAFSSGNVLLASVPPSTQPAFCTFPLTLVEPRHVLVLLGGSLGAIACAHWLLERGHQIGGLTTFAETDLMPFICRKTAPDTVRIDGAASQIGLGVFPGSRTARTHAVLEPLLCRISSYPQVLGAGLGAIGVLLSSMTIVMNAARIERSYGGFRLYEEGLTPGVARVIELLDGERRAVSAVLGCDQPPISTVLSAAGYGPEGDLWSTVHGSHALSRVESPISLRTSWHSDNVSFGLRTWVELGEKFGVPMPAMRGVVGIADSVMGVDSWQGGRSLKHLGIDTMSGDRLIRYLETGSAE